MRILGGNFKGRNIIVPEGIRPVSQLVRKACFDILREEIKQKSVLDLFAGSGSLGIEALSWGAKEVCFIDSQQSCVNSVKNSVSPLKVENRVKIYLKDAFLAIRNFSSRKSTFEIIFIDPPYGQGLLTKALQLLVEYDILAPCGYLVAFCYLKDDFSGEGRKLSRLVEKKYGQTRMLIYRNDEKSHLSGNF